MKTFLNVLYRRILYKIPFKWLLVFLVVVGVFLFTRVNAENVSNLINVVQEGTLTYSANTNYVLKTIGSSDYGIYCLNVVSYTAWQDRTNLQYGMNDVSGQLPAGNYLNIWKDQVPYTACIRVNQPYIILNNVSAGIKTFTYKLYRLDILLDTPLPVMTSLECQTEYSLIPVSSVDENYCVSNDLCPSYNCPNVGVSNLFINDIFHPGAFNIVMNIPEEIDRDYAYTNSGQNMNIDVVGYNVDYEKIGAIVDNQSYIPTGEDFQHIVGILAPYTKIIVFFVFLFIVWAWIKKPFKSKKL